MNPPTIPAPCRHLHTDGRQCGSPALRGGPLCYHHRALRQPIPIKTLEGQTIPQLPAPDDYLAIQRGIAEVLRLLANDEISDRRAATLLRGLAAASQNLARAHRQERHLQATQPHNLPVSDLALDPALGNLAPDPAGPIQQNQDLTPLDEENSATSNLPSPTYLFTPHPTLPLADELRFGELYMEMQVRARDQRRHFEATKTAELEARFEAKLQAFTQQTQDQPKEETLHLALAS